MVVTSTVYADAYIDSFARVCNLFADSVSNNRRSCRIPYNDIEKLDKLCDSKVNKACWILGNYYKLQFYENQSNEYYEKACNLNHVESCEWAANYFHDRGEYSSSAKFFEKACNLGATGSCQMLAGQYQYGAGVDKDLGKAKKYYAKSCDAGDSPSCISYITLTEKD